MPTEELFAKRAFTLPGPDPVSMGNFVALPIGAELVTGINSLKEQSDTINYFVEEARASKEIDPDDPKVIEALEQIKNLQIQEAERLEAEGKIDEAIALLGLSPADAAAVIDQTNQAEIELAAAEEAEKERQAEIDRKNAQNATLALVLLGAAGFYFYSRRK